MDALIPRYCLSLLLLTAIAASTESNVTSQEELREPRVSGRIVKLYSGAKPEPYLCPGEGFQADPNNCNVFYRCVKERSGKFTVFRYQCAPGTVYDPDLETCNHPRNTRRSECGGMLKATSEPFHTTNINEIDGAQSEVPHPISTKVPTYTVTEHTTPKKLTTKSWILSTERENTSTKIPWGPAVYNTPNTVSANKHKPTEFATTSGYYWPSATHQLETKLTSKTTASPKTTQQSNLNNNDLCTSDGFMGDSENCRKFYRCVGNQRGGYVKYEFSCSELTIWDDEIQGCNHPWAVKRSKCGRSLSYDEKVTPQNYETDSSQRSIPQSSIINTKDSVTNDGEYGHRLNKITQQQLQMSYGSKVTQIQTQINNSPGVIQNQTQINYGNKMQNDGTSELKQNQTQISDGNAVSQTQTQIDYGNKEVQTQLQIDHFNKSSQSQVQVQEFPVVKPTKTTSGQNSDNEKNECSESGFIGDVKDCRKFYRCVDNGRGRYTKFEYFCGDGTVWDPEIEACNHAWAVKHCGGKLPAESTTEGYPTTTTIKSTEYHTSPTKTTQSYQITSLMTQAPDSDGEDDIGYGNQNNQETTPSTTTTTTVKSTTTTTVTSIGTSTQCMSGGFIGDANNCKIFYRCVDNGNGGFTKHEFKCGDGTLWDSDIEACNHAWAVKNCRESISGNIDKEEATTKKENTGISENVQTTVTLVQITTQATTQIDDYETAYGSQNYQPSMTTNKSTKQPQEQENIKSSDCKSNGFMGDEKDCNKFYRCVDNGNGNYIRYEFRCGEGTVWDPKIEACNHAWAVEKCGGSSNVVENIETSSQPIYTTISSGTSSIQTTQVSKETGQPVSVTTTSTTSSSTIASSDVSNKCSKNGFMGNNSDCKKFYRCVDNGDGSYTRYEFTCGEGTLWDSKIEACNHAWAVENCGGNIESTPSIQQTTSQQPVMQDEEQENGYATPNYEISQTSQTTLPSSSSSVTSMTSSGTGQCNNSGFIGDKNDCKKFYRCVDNGKGGYDRYEFQCGEGTVWDGSIEACNHAWAVKNCGESMSGVTHYQNESTTQPISSSITSENNQTQQSTEKTTTSTEAYHESEAIGNQCVQEGFFANEIDCTKFYRCVDNGKNGFTKYEFTCGEGTSWNQEIQGCDHANRDRSCRNTSHVTTSTESNHLNDDMDTLTSPTEKPSQSTETTNKPQESSICNSEGFYANPFNCKKFYRCVANGNGGYTKYEFDCGDKTVWNQNIQACDHESADNICFGTSTNQTNGTGSQSESTTNSYSTTKRQDTTTNITQEHESTQAAGSECTSEGFFAHPNDCKKFIRCVSNGNAGYTRYEFSCGDGTVWVQEIQACDHDNNINSCDSQKGSTTTFNPQNTDEHSSNTSASSSISSTESMTPIREDDEYETGESKEPSHDETGDCTSEGYFPDKQDCRKFYRCVDNGNGGYTKYDFVCGEGTAWDSNLQTCNHINEVQSCSGSTQEGNENHQTSTNKSPGETDSSSSTTKATTSSTESSGPTSNSQDTCEDEGYYGNSKDCKKFYRCVDNGKGGYTKYEFTCGDGTIWDQDITGCNYPQDVSNPSCSSNQGNSDVSSTTSSTTTSSTQTTSSSSSQSTSDYSQESSKKPSNSNVTCDKAGYYANPNDCKKFYRCVDWDGDGKRFSVFHFECGEGTIWDPALDTCNHEDSVYPQRDCSQTQSQNVGGETTTAEEASSTTKKTESNTNEPTTEESTTSKQTTEQSSTTIEQTTTQQPTTSEQTTTEQSTNEPTTTQQSTTSEKTTTQESMTSEQTTAQPTTSEKTTTQESITSEKTTTQQPTTTEETTTQEPNTTEQTTTQQSTTSEQTTTTTESTTTEQTTTQESSTESMTTQESITSELTTIQQPTTSEQTQEPTTSEQTTTQQSTTSEQTTTQELTTSEQITTQESTTSDQTTTQQLTTTDQPTTQESTTTQQSTTTDQTMTQESTTTEQTTTQQSTTTDQTTTQESATTEQTTTQQSNEQTTEQTTDRTTTEETTEQSTTQTSSTESDSTEEQSTTEISSTTEAPSSSNKECPETENDQYVLVCPTSFRRHPKYCNMFYQCTEDEDTYEAKTAMFKCPNNTIYDESQTQCVSEEKADKKCEGEIANKRRFKRLGFNYKEPIVADKEKLSCSAAGYFSFEKNSECAKGFLKCERSKNGKLRGHVYQCPNGYTYWSISKRCERMENVRDCKRSSNDWTERWNIPVERKNVAVG